MVWLAQHITYCYEQIYTCVNELITVQPRPVNWNEDYSIMYIDNPVSQFVSCVNCDNVFQVGTGFSFTDSDDGYSTNEIEVADNLYE